MSKAFAIDAERLMGFIYIDEGPEDLRIECNECSHGDYLFYAGNINGMLVMSSKWLMKAVVHVDTHHKP